MLHLRQQNHEHDFLEHYKGAEFIIEKFDIIREERREAHRHDKLYKEKKKAYILQAGDWEKYDLIKKPTRVNLYYFKRLGNIQGKKVLDLGCGTGWLSVILAKRGASVEALDVSPEAVKIAQNMALVNQVSDKINCKVGSAYELEYPDNYFDFVVGVAILHHLAYKSSLAASLYKVLKPGGKGIFLEAFGESVILEKIRLLIPVPIAEEDNTHWGEQIKYNDLRVFKGLFTVNYKEFQLFSRLDRIISIKPFVRFLNWMDSLILKYIPLLRRYARAIVIELIKEKLKP